MPKLANLTRPSVGLVEVFDGGSNLIASGSGFFLSGNRFVTNCHVIDGAKSVKVKMETGEEFDSIGVLASDAKKDIAVLFIACKAQKALILSKAGSVEAGSHIAVIGSPLGLEGTVSDGIVSGQRQTASGPLLQITAPISHGSSGSPVINDGGEVVGVAFLNVEGGQALNFAISASTVQVMLDKITDKTPFARYPDSSSDQELQLLREPDYQQAMDLIQHDNYDDALQILKRLSQKYPRAAEIYYQLGYIFDRGKLWSEAVDAYNQAADLDPTAPDIWYQMGITLTRANKDKEAIAALEKAAALAPKDTRILEVLGSEYNNIGDYKDSIATFSNAVAIDPSSGNYGMLGGAYYGLGQRQEADGDHRGSIATLMRSSEVWEAARKLFPEWSGTLVGMAEDDSQMAIAWQNLHSMPEAKKLMEFAMSIAPNDMVVVFNASKFYYAAGDVEQYRAEIANLYVISPSAAAMLQSDLQSHRP